MTRDADASDEELAERTRRGDAKAYAELWRRHSHAGQTAAQQFRSIADPEDIVAEGYLQILRALQRGGGPHEAFRPYLYRTVRNIALSWNRKKPEDPLELADDLESPGATLEDTVLEKTITVRAFRTLPERWQTVLWYTEVEGMEPREAAPYLGLTPNSAAALALRAREGLKKAWLQAHVAESRVPVECRWTTERMGDYVRGALSARAQERFDDHLNDCTRCSILVEEVDNVGSKLAVVLFPLVLGGSAGAALLAQLRNAPASTSTASAVRPPRSGVSRLLVGAVAAAGTLGIAAAFALPAVLDSSSAEQTTSQEPTTTPKVTTDGGDDTPIVTPSAAPPPAPTPAPQQPEPPRESVEPAKPVPPTVPPVVVAPVDTDAPAAPVLLDPADGLLTNDAQPLFTGTGEPGATLSGVYASGEMSTEVGADGTWQVRPTAPLPDGTATVLFTQTDAAGNRSETAAVSLTIDTVALPPTVTALPADPIIYLPVITGSGEPGATVQVDSDGIPVGTAPVDDAGGWSFALPDPGIDGTRVSATQTDLAGNTSGSSDPSAALTFIRPSIDSPADGETIPSDNGATVVTVQLSGIEGMQVEILLDGVATGNLHTLGQVPIARVTPPLADGQHTIAVRYRDATGQIGSLLTHTILIQP